MKVACTLIFFVLCAYADLGNDDLVLDTNIKVSQLKNRESVQGVLANVTTDPNYALFGDLYSIFVPENATSVTVYFNSGFVGSNAEKYNDKINVNVRSHGIPCGDALQGGYYFCQEFFKAITIGSATGSGSFTFNQTAHYGTGYKFQPEYNVGGYMYLSVNRVNEAFSPSNGSISYNLTVVVEEGCPAGYVSNITGSGCIQYSCVTSLSAINMNTSGAYVYKIKIPPNTARVDIHASSYFLNDVELYPLYRSEFYGCTYPIEKFGGSSGTWTFDIKCYPTAGDFYYYVGVPASPSDFVTPNVNINFVLISCNDTTGGPQCDSPIKDITSDILSSSNSNHTYTLSLTAPNASSKGIFNASYFYFDVSSEFQNKIIAIYGSANGSDYCCGQSRAYLVARLNSYPQYQDDYQDLATSSYLEDTLSLMTILTPYDFVVGGRWWIMVECHAAVCEATFTVSVTTSEFKISGYTADPARTCPAFGGNSDITSGSSATSTVGTISTSGSLDSSTNKVVFNGASQIVASIFLIAVTLAI